MTDINELKEIIRKLDLEISGHDFRYYVQNNPIIPDAEYDRKLVKLRELVGSLNPIDRPITVLDRIGSDISGKLPVVEHLHPMVSLRTEVDTSVAPIQAWLTRVSERIPSEDIDIITEMKYDGLGVSIQLLDGSLVRAVTRGDGEKGDDITMNISKIPALAPYFKGAVTGIPSDYDELRGEVIMLRDYLEEVNALRAAEGETPYVNCRNAVAGIVRSSKTPDYVLNHIVFIPYTLTLKPGGEDKFKTQRGVLLSLKDLFDPRVQEPILSSVLGSSTALEAYANYKVIEDRRDSLPIDIDGAVHKLNVLVDQRKLGISGREPRWAIAHKYAAERAITRLESIELQVGAFGAITPVAKITPVFVGGVTVSSVTLSNVFQIRKKGIRVGDLITVQRAGDVIPEILGREGASTRFPYVDNFRMPAECPCCGGPIVRPKGQAKYRCFNRSCSDQVIGRFVHVSSRGILDIEGLGPSVAEILESNCIDTLNKLFKLTAEQLYEMGLGPVESENLVREVHRAFTRPITMDRAIRALAIPTIGDSASRELANFLSTPKEVIDYLTMVASVSEESPVLKVDNVREIKNWYTPDNIEEAFRLLSTLNIIEQDKSYRPLEGKTVVVTGGHSDYSRSDIKDMVSRLGGKPSGSVSAKTSLVVYGDGAGENLRKAEKHGVKRLTINDFVKAYKK